ncbi:MAG: hypothetical protein KW788_03530 [Candidatus Doudnabacteria bacterium]|nr:hypothetical protein [Candidatus Doudnabacteria bacterium]
MKKLLIVAVSVILLSAACNRQSNVAEPAQNPKSTSSTSTANWKTYTSTKYGFQIKIPSDWVVDENPAFGKIAFTSSDYLSILEEAHQYNNSQQDNNEQGADLFFDIGRAPEILSPVEDVKIGDNTFQHYRGGQNISASNFEIQHNVQIYRFENSVDVSDDFTKQILSTFKFTK